MKKIKHFINTRRILSLFIILVILGIGYYSYKKLTATAGKSSYIVSNIKKGNIISTVTGTGQISASSQIDLKSKASGNLVFLNTKANGTEIKKGTLIAQVDTRDIAITLENAKIAYAKLTKPADASTMLQAENSLNDAVLANKKSYEDSFNTISSTFSDLPSVMSGLDTILYSQNGYLNYEKARQVSQTAMDYQSKAGISLDKAKMSYTTLLVEYKNLSRSSTASSIESFLSSTYLLVKDISNVVKNTQNTLDYVRNQRNDGSGTTETNSLSSWTSTINSDLANLLSAKSSIVTANQDIQQKTIDLAKLKSGPDSLDIASQKLDLQQKEYSYEDYFIRAPFDGILARLSVKPTDTISSGAIIGTLVSSQKISTITLNEIDVGKVSVGQKAKLTFDAIEGLTIDGTVITVDLVGTVTQGVVNYNVEIALDTQDERIKSGMSVTSSIITDTKEDVLVIPNSAIKTQGKFSYVEMFTAPLVITKGGVGTPSATPPIQKRVEVGVSNDSLTEIISGINEGDQVVVRTIAPTTTATTAAPSLFGSGTRVGGNAGGATGGTRTGGTRN